MAEESRNTDKNAHYKMVQPSGLAAEVASGEKGKLGDAALFGTWLKEKLDSASADRNEFTLLSGVTPNDLDWLFKGQALFPLDADHLQRFATALLEMGILDKPDQLWQAAGFDTSDYITPPSEVVRSLSGTT